jgi:ApaG protein
MTAEKQYEFSISVETTYVPEQSDEAENHYVFSYTITIVNIGKLPAQLISRHWIIKDATDGVQEVRGLGVVGAQPFLRGGEQFQYTSGCVLTTPVGSMEGSYQMVGEDGSSFEVPIPKFTLNMPRVLH